MRLSNGAAPPDWVPAWRTLTAICGTASSPLYDGDPCPNYGVQLKPNVATNADGIDRVLCGACEEWIENLSG